MSTIQDIKVKYGVQQADAAGDTAKSLYKEYQNLRKRKDMALKRCQQDIQKIKSSVGLKQDNYRLWMDIDGIASNMGDPAKKKQLLQLKKLLAEEHEFLTLW